MRVELDEIAIREAIQRIKQGERAAFSVVYDLTITFVYRTTALLLKHHVDTADVVQEIYFQLFNAINCYDYERSFKLWLLGIVYRQSSAYRRKRWLSFRLQQKVSQHMNEHDEVSVANQEDYAEKAYMEQLLNQLPYKQRQVVVFKYYHDLSQQAIAQVLEIPVGTVKSRLNSALKTLRGEYDKVFQLHELRSVES